MLQTEKRNFKRILFFLFYPFIFLMRVIPRNKNIWIFGIFKGYIDNTKYLYEYLIYQIPSALDQIQQASLYCC